MPAQTLGIPNTSERQLLGVSEIPCDLAIEQAEFLNQCSMTMIRKRLDEIFDHRSQPSHNLQIIRTARSDFTECQMYEILPVWGTEKHAQLPGLVQDLVGTQIALTNCAQHTVQLIDCEHRCGRIIDRR